MGWRACLAAVGLSLAAGMAQACPQPAACGADRHGPAYERRHEPAPYLDERPGEAEDAFDQGRYGDDGFEDAPEGHLLYPPADAGPELAWENPDGSWYIHGRRAAPCGAACRPCACAGEVRLNDSFFADAGGVGPIPDGGFYGGGGFFVVDGGRSVSGASSRAFASASAHASANVAVRFRGGGHGGFKGRHGGGRMGHGGKGH